MQINSDKSVDPPYPVYGGLFREEAIMLLRRFYVQENEKGALRFFMSTIPSVTDVYVTAPEPKPKKNRELKTEILPVPPSRLSTPMQGTPTPQG